jgi:2-polyprenyl-3-methyl-5-hydroxy-6-metoxy-1,4-benzoquinol methylase
MSHSVTDLGAAGDSDGAKFRCQVCAADALTTVDGYDALPRVTSDCKPWPAGGTMTVCAHCGAVQKLPDAKWHEEIGSIYGGYQIYDLSAGAEQVIFDGAGKAVPRSRALVDFVLANAGLPASGRLIDIGCGNGAALANFSRALPDWSLFGTELSETPLPWLRRLPNFVELYTGSASDIPHRFDLVSMIHSLEHMPNPLEALRSAATLLSDSGAMFVEVPNIETSPFDLLVADHLLHLSPRHLARLASRAGLAVSLLRGDVLPKEITMLAGHGAAQPHSSAGADARERVQRYVDWFGRVIAQAEALARQGGKIGIFGTSISGMWLYGAIRWAVSFFVDEDQTRIGRSYDGLPIVSPADIPAGASVLLPLSPPVARNIVTRIGGGRAMFVVPPAMEA